MYDNPQYGKMRDSGFQLFYMFINVGAIFAPLTAIWVRNWWVEKNGFFYDADLPALAHQYLGNTITPEGTQRFQQLAAEVGFTGTDLTAFSNEYLNVFSTGFHYAFAVAILAMLISLVIYMANKKRFPDPAAKAADGSGHEGNVEMDVKEVRQRLYALFAVFAVVIFFWFSFHQNGLTLTFFARDYTDLSQLKINLGFSTLQGAEIFQTFNPLFVVFLTPLSWVLRLAQSQRKRALYSPEDSYRDGYCRGRVRGNGRGVDRTAQQSRSGRDGRTTGRGKGYTVVAYRNVLHPYRGRAVYQPTWYLIRVEGGAT